MKGATEPPV